MTNPQCALIDGYSFNRTQLKLLHRNKLCSLKTCIRALVIWSNCSRRIAYAIPRQVSPGSLFCFIQWNCAMSCHYNCNTVSKVLRIILFFYDRLKFFHLPLMKERELWQTVRNLIKKNCTFSSFQGTIHIIWASITGWTTNACSGE